MPPKTIDSEHLTPRERQIARLVRVGYHDRQIVQRLAISAPIFRQHLGNIFRKLGISDKLELAVHARRNEW